MSKYCGGINLNLETLKIIKGIICDVNASTVDVSKAVSTCGQLWDGNLFAVVKVGDRLKLVDGIITDSENTAEVFRNPVSTCGQAWDSDLFVATMVDGHKVITLHNSEGEDVGKPVFIKGNCGVGLDGRFFSIEQGKVNFQDGFVLTVNVTPADATIKITDVDFSEVAPIAGTTNTFLLSGIGDNYTVLVGKTGYITKTQTVVNNGDQIIEIELVEKPE